MLEDRRLLSVPPAPTLSVDSTSSSSITLSYSYDGVSDLTLEAKGPADINFHTITPTWNTGAQTVSVTGLLDETTYVFRMVAELACQQSYGSVQGTTLATDDQSGGDHTLSAPVIGAPQDPFVHYPPLSYTPVGCGRITAARICNNTPERKRHTHEE